MAARSLLLALALLFATGAYAVPIEYRFTGTGGGSLGGVAFAGRSFEVIGFSDTIAVFQNQFGFPLYQGPLFQGARVAIDGFDVADFLIPAGLNVFSNTDGEFVALRRFGPSSQPNFLSLIATGQGLDTWDHTTSIGPLTGFGVPGRDITGGIQDTTLGPLFFNAIQSLEFRATVAPVPLPPAIGLFFAALSTVGTLRLFGKARS